MFKAFSFIVVSMALMALSGCAALEPTTPSDGRVYQFAFVLQDGKRLGASAVMPDGTIVPLIWQDAAGDVSSDSQADAKAKGELRARVAQPGGDASGDETDGGQDDG